MGRWEFWVCWVICKGERWVSLEIDQWWVDGGFECKEDSLLPSGTEQTRATRVTRPTVHRMGTRPHHQRRKHPPQPHLAHRLPIPFHSILPHPEKHKHQPPSPNLNPPIESYYSPRGDHNHRPSVQAVDARPGVGRDGVGGVLVEDEGLRGEEGEDEDKGHIEEAEEAGFGECRGGGCEDGGEGCAVAAHAEDYQDYSFVS